MSQRTTLIVDDEGAVRHYLKFLLRREGFDTLEAEGGNQAWDIVRQIDGKLDLLITDLTMPEGDGVSLTRAVRHLYPWIPIILTSGYVETQVPEVEVQFVQKPFRVDALLDLIRRITAQSGPAAGCG